MTSRRDGRRFVKSCLFACAATALLSASLPASAEDSAEPLRYPPSSVRTKLVVGGLATTGVAYGTSVLFASGWPEVPGSDELKIPVVGPWLSLAKNDCAPDDPDCGFILYFRGFLLILDGFMQAGGLGIAGEGVFMTTEAPRQEAARATSSLVVRPVPMVTPSSTGLGVVGSF